MRIIFTFKKFNHLFLDFAPHLSITIGVNQLSVIDQQSVTIITQDIREMKGEKLGKSGERKKIDVIGPGVEMLGAKLLRKFVNVIISVARRTSLGKISENAK